MVISQELVDAILEMKKEGYTRSEIIQAMSSQGYTPREIEEHLRRADMVGQESLYYEPAKPVPPPISTAQSVITEPSPMRTEVDEDLIESIVEDKLRSFVDKVEKVNDWKDKVMSRIDKLEQSVSDMKERVDSLNKAIISKIERGEEQMVEVGSEMKAMQKVFRESIPELTKAISALKMGAKKKKS